MRYPYDVGLFLAGVLTGSYATRQRHLRQAKLIQAEIAKRWQRHSRLGRESIGLGFLSIA